MPIKVGFVSLGCAKNRVDTEFMIGSLSQNKNFNIVADESLAEVIVINTCAFIQSAKEEAINTILEFVKKKNTVLKSIIVTGCLAERYKEEILKNIPEINAVIGINSQHLLEQAITASLEKNKFESFEKSPCNDANKKRILTTPSHYAYLKIAEGCNNFCSFCAIPYIRGPYKSRSIKEILKEAEWLCENNVKELILIAQNTTYYGFDLYKEFKLSELLEQLSKLNFKWIRFLYAYPELIDINLIKTIARNKNILPYFDIPIQHINDEILKKMNRKTNKTQIVKTINLIRNMIPDATIRTSLIVGFPQETQKQFEELLDFVTEIKFDRLGCFKYSKEENTKAFNFKNQIKESIKRERQMLIYEQSEKIIKKQSLNKINTTLTAMVEQKTKDNFYIARTEKDAPDVDCCVIFKSNKTLKNGDFVNLKITGTKNLDLIGDLI